MNDTMKLSELRPCDSCRGALKNGIFYVVDVRLAVINAEEANAGIGLMRQLGGSLALAEAMGATPSPVKLMPLESATRVLLCQDCYVERLGEPSERATAAEAGATDAR